MAKGKKGGKKGKKKDEPVEEAPADEVAMADEFMIEESLLPPEHEIVIPEDQLQLTEEELAEEHMRTLTDKDPNVPNNLVKWSYKSRSYAEEPPVSGAMIAVHYSYTGYMLHKDGEDAKAQRTWRNDKKEQLLEERRAAKGDGADTDVDDVKEAGKNQFNYSERAAQTFNNAMRSRGVETQPPTTVVFGDTVTQWHIYDAYVEQYLSAQREAELAKKSQMSSKKKKTVVAGAEDKEPPKQEKDDDVMHTPEMGRMLKILERMVNQNAEDEIFQDFKYWEDQSDQFRDGEGSLLPLWRFSTDRTKRKQVTAISWNPRYPDMFAVGYGSYDFMRQGSGMICCFSLKNTSHPEYTFSTESGVMCLDFHPQHQALLAVGCYDGTVLVYDVRNKVNKPIYVSTIRTGKHTDPVWQVSWQEEDIAKELSFFSVSSDGRVANWVMSKNELKMEPVMQLKLVNAERDEPDEETTLTGLAGGCCFDFNKTSEHLFIVGTEEGKIHKCSKAYSGQYLQTYEGHHMAIYAVKWNPFHPRVFISCSADWTIKLWDHSLPFPVMSFDLGNAVGDIAWAPYSSTVFSAVTSDGKVHVFDLSVNKHEPLCEQKVVKRAKLTHIVFNVNDPLLLVGDDRGGVNSLKLSPNLRKTTGDPATEIEKMQKLLDAADTRQDG